jgi:trans-2,3-dihydro-3-hydroxyanthranilate isomerase
LPRFKFHAVDVFTDRRFGGNQLAVVKDAEGIDGATMQSLAAEFNFSETTFVLPPDDGANSARVRIFNRTAEMAFAGHPMVGTAFVLALDRPDVRRLAFEAPAGLVRVEVVRDDRGAPVGARVAAPQPLSMGEEVPVETVAACLGLAPGDILTGTHRPVAASVGNPYVIAEVTGEALARCLPDVRAFRQALAARPQFGKRFSLHVYARDGQRLRARMFAPLSGTWEDPATGSANAPLACLLLQRSGAEREEFEIHQGVEMGRPSLLLVSAERRADGVHATLFGKCVAVMCGEIILD